LSSRRRATHAILVAAVALLVMGGWLFRHSFSEPEPGADVNPSGPVSARTQGAPVPARHGVPVAAPPKATVAELRLSLVSTAVFDAPDLSRATIRDLEATEYQVLAIGEVLAKHPDVRLARIDERAVLLDRNGHKIELRLGVEPEETPAELRARAMRAGEHLAGGDFSRAVHELYPEAEAVEPGRVRPLARAGSTAASIEVVEIVPGGLYARLGLREGDRIESINGVPVGSATTRGAEQAVGDDEPLALTIVRDGVRREVKAGVDLTLASPDRFDRMLDDPPVGP
jgi:type II secretory pathway component PulC